MNAKRDQNFVPTRIAVLNTDGKTIQRLVANSSTYALMVNDGTTGTSYPPERALKDENGVSTMLAVSYLDGKTLVQLQADSSGSLLVDSS